MKTIYDEVILSDYKVFTHHSDILMDGKVAAVMPRRHQSAEQHKAGAVVSSFTG
jgi:hypothetical protein